MAEKIVSYIEQLSGNYQDLLSLNKYLKENEDIICKWGNTAYDSMLNYLDYGRHSLGIVHLLYLKSANVISDIPEFFRQVQKLVDDGSAYQISMIGARFAYIARRFADECVKAKQPMRAVAVLRKAVVRYRPTPETLTPVHQQFFMACLASKNYKAALPILQQEILYVNGGGATPRDLMLFGYYGGMLYLGQKQFEQACKLFDICLTVPAMALSAIMVEAYKKYVLASLLATGNPPVLSKATASIVQRNLKVCAIAYVELSNAYQTRDIGEVGKVIVAHQKTFTTDKNFGLILQAAASLPRLNVKRLTKTYLKLPAADVAQSCQLKDAAEAIEVVVRLALAGQVYATIDQRSGMITFNEPEEKYDDTRCVQQLDTRMQQAIWLTRQLRELDERTMTSSSYLTRVITERSESDAPPGMVGGAGAAGAASAAAAAGPAGAGVGTKRT